MARKTKTGLIVPARARKELTRLQVVNPDNQWDDGIPTPEPLEDLVEAYSVHSWVYTAAWTIASNLAGLEWKAYRQDAEGLWEQFDKHEFLPFLRRPNPYMTAYQLREFTYLSLELTGNAYWVFEKAPTGKIKEIWTVPSGMMRAVSTKERFIDHFVYSVNGKDIRFEYNEVLHFKYMNPASMVYGQGSLTAAKLAVMQDLYAQAYNKYFFKNAGRPDAALTTDQVLTEDVRTRVMKAWDKMHQGAEKRGKTAVLEGGMKYQELNRTPKDMDFVSLRELSREEILSAFGVPPIMAGVLKDTNYNTAREQKRIFWERTLIPKKRSCDEMLTMRAAQIFFDPQTIFEADTSHVEALRADMEQLSTTAQNFYRIGIPLNEIIDKLDLPFDPVEGGDVPVAFGQAPAAGGTGAPAGDPAAQNTQPKAQPKTETTKDRRIATWKSFDMRTREAESDMAIELRGYFGSQRRRVLSALEREADRLIGEAVAKALPNYHIDLLFRSADEEKRMRYVTDKHIQRTYLDFAVRSARNVKPGFDFNLINPRTVDYITRKQLKLVREVTEYTRERITSSVVDGVREAVEEGLSRGEAVQRIADRIDDFYEFSRESRSERIARTETISSANAGSLDGMQAAGVERKRWLAAQDDRVRDTHAALDGVEEVVDGAFMSDSGAVLEFPGDPSAPPEEVINCRCTIVAVLDGGERSARAVPPVRVVIPKVREEKVTLTRDVNGKVIGSVKENIYDEREV